MSSPCWSRSEGARSWWQHRGLQKPKQTPPVRIAWTGHVRACAAAHKPRCISKPPMPPPMPSQTEVVSGHSQQGAAGTELGFSRGGDHEGQQHNGDGLHLGGVGCRTARQTGVSKSAANREGRGGGAWQAIGSQKGQGTTGPCAGRGREGKNGGESCREDAASANNGAVKREAEEREARPKQASRGGVWEGWKQLGKSVLGWDGLRQAKELTDLGWRGPGRHLRAGR